MTYHGNELLEEAVRVLSHHHRDQPRSRAGLYGHGLAR